MGPVYRLYNIMGAGPVTPADPADDTGNIIIFHSSWFLFGMF